MVVVEVGHNAGTPAGYSIVAADVALDIKTGQQLWTAAVPGRHQSPPIAMTGDVVVTESPTGGVTARQALSGAVLWQRARPSECPSPAGQSFSPTMGLTADGPLLAASFQCADGRLMVERLTASSGESLWQWTSPNAGSSILLSAVGAAQQGTLILLAGQIAPPTAAERFVRGP